MSDRQRSDADSGDQQLDRESRAETLLVEGLDQYLAGHYDDAIHIWTRVLFLDRNHQRARAYIERARTTLGERQRRADELIHRAQQHVIDGALVQARALLAEIGTASADDSGVARLWSEIERAERARPQPVSVPAAPLPAIEPAFHRVRGVPLAAVGKLIAAGAIGAFVIAVVTSPTIGSWFGVVESVVPHGPAGRPPALAGPGEEEIALIRARTLYGKGRLAEALDVLDRVGPVTAQRAEVDALRVEIQGVLLSTAALPPLAAEGIRP
jgi:hypothetical protein